MLNRGNAFANTINKERKTIGSPISKTVGRGVFKAKTVFNNPKTGEKYIDPQGRGRLAAYIPSLNGDPFDPYFFEYASPFGGAGAGGSYGFFGAPVDEGVTILVTFADNGKEGYWFAVAQEIPDVVSGGSSGKAKVTGDGQGEGLYKDIHASKDTPVTRGDASVLSVNERDNSVRNKVLANQGTYSDPLRGPSTASPTRDAGYSIPQQNKVTGFKTPSGCAISMDDGSVADDGTLHPEQIRITTASGSGIILDGSNDFIYAVNSDGSCWIEIGANGEVMVYAKGSMSVRTEKDFNVRAAKNINLEAAENINIHSIGNTKLNSDNELHIRSKGTQFIQTEAQMNISVGVNCVVSTGGLLHLNGPIAAESELIQVDSKPDMQNAENTEVKGTIVSEMPTHEPFIRPHAKDLSTSDYAKAYASEDGKKNMG